VTRSSAAVMLVTTDCGAVHKLIGSNVLDDSSRKAAGPGRPRQDIVGSSPVDLEQRHDGRVPPR